jgi:hypothetical protein
LYMLAKAYRQNTPKCDLLRATHLVDLAPNPGLAV